MADPLSETGHRVDETYLMIMIGFKPGDVSAGLACAVHGLRKMFSNFASSDLIVYSALLTHGMGRFVGAAPVEGVNWQVLAAFATDAAPSRRFV